MGYVEKRGNLWRARWRGPDGSLESMPGFQRRKDAEDYARDQEAAIRNNAYVDPRAGRSRSPNGSTPGSRLKTWS